MLISGVALFSFLMGSFIDILSTYQDLSANLDQGDTLSKFFGTLKHFHEEQDIDHVLKKQIEQYFDYYWSNFKGAAFQSDHEKRIMGLLPHAVQDKLYKDFLFTDFFENFETNYFRIPTKT